MPKPRWNAWRSSGVGSKPEEHGAGRAQRGGDLAAIELEQRARSPPHDRAEGGAERFLDHFAPAVEKCAVAPFGGRAGEGQSTSGPPASAYTSRPRSALMMRALR